MRKIAVVCLLSTTLWAQGNWQKPGEIRQPKGTWQRPGDIQAPKGIQAIKAQEQVCMQRLTVAADALFEFDKASLTPDAEQTLTALGPMIEKAGKHPVRVTGHTDSIGTDAYNQKLSEKRARAVEEWLVGHRYLTAAATEGFGKTQPVAPNTNSDGTDNPVGRQQNRRVEVIIDTCN